MDTKIHKVSYSWNYPSVLSAGLYKCLIIIHQWQVVWSLTLFCSCFTVHNERHLWSSTGKWIRDQNSTEEDASNINKW